MIKKIKQKITDYLNLLSVELRQVIDYKKQKPKIPHLRKLGQIILILWTFVFLLIGCENNKAHAAEAPPVDLTGYTVSVPANWVASAGYGVFHSLEGNLVTSNGSNYTITSESLYIGYSGYVDFGSWETNSTSNAITISNLYADVTNEQSLTFFITGGPDASSSSLVQWFVDNNASFSNGSSPSVVTVSPGLYYFQNTYVNQSFDIEFSMPFISRSQYFSSIDFSYFGNDGYLISYLLNSNSSLDVYHSSDGWNYAEYSVILVQNGTEMISSDYELFSSAFVPLADDYDYNTLFLAGQENGYSFGLSQGYDDGYANGLEDGVAEGMEDGFMGNFFGGIVQALDALKIFGNFSVLDIIECVLGLMLVLFILKLIAGG